MNKNTSSNTVLIATIIIIIIGIVVIGYSTQLKKFNVANDAPKIVILQIDEQVSIYEEVSKAKTKYDMMNYLQVTKADAKVWLNSSNPSVRANGEAWLNDD